MQYDILPKDLIKTSLDGTGLIAVEAGKQAVIRAQILESGKLSGRFGVMLKTGIFKGRKWFAFRYKGENIWEISFRVKKTGIFGIEIHFFEKKDGKVDITGESIRIKGCLRVDLNGMDVIKTIFIREYGKKDPITGNVQSGTFRDVLPYLPEFKKNQIDALILLPVHPLGCGLWGPVGSPYEPLDYFTIEPSLVKNDWHADSISLKKEYRRFIARASGRTRGKFKEFGADKRIEEFCIFRAVRILAARLKIIPGDAYRLKDTEAFAELKAYVQYEQFIAYKEFRRFVNKAHSVGLKILMDIPGYLGSESIVHLFYDNYIARNPDGSYYQPGFREWGKGWYTLRQLDSRNPEAVLYLSSVYKYWSDRMKVDGFRLDALFTQPVKTVRMIRQCCPSSFLIGEAIGDYKKDIERLYLDDIKLNAVYSPEWIWANDLEKYLENIHKSPSSWRLLHMRDTHDEGRLKKGDIFTTPKKRYLGVLAAGILGLPGKEIIGLLDGNLTLAEGTPNLYDISHRQTCKKNETRIIFGKGKSISSSGYIEKLLMLRKTLPEIKMNGNIDFICVKDHNILSFARRGTSGDLIAVINIGKMPCHNTVKINKKLFPLKTGELRTEDIITGEPIHVIIREDALELCLSLDIGQSHLFYLPKMSPVSALSGMEISIHGFSVFPGFPPSRE